MGLGSKQDWSQFVDLDIPKAATRNEQQQQQQQKRPILQCPRCESTNTKFCYYNNYSRLQPRHFCRACKRHWTAGGTLRNVPVGGGHRSKRAKTSHDDDRRRANSSEDNNAHHQQQASLPLIDTAIFPDVFRQVMSQPPLLPLLPPPPLPPSLPDIGPVATENFYSVCGSSSSTSSFYGLMDGYDGGDWLQEGLAQPASYVNCWDGMLEFDALNE